MKSERDLEHSLTSKENSCEANVLLVISKSKENKIKLKVMRILSNSNSKQIKMCFFNISLRLNFWTVSDLSSNMQIKAMSEEKLIHSQIS